MSNAAIIRHNAKLVLRQVRGKSKAERWKHYACLMLGMALPVVAIAKIWRDGKVCFNVDTSITWAQARSR